MITFLQAIPLLGCPISTALSAIDTECAAVVKTSSEAGGYLALRRHGISIAAKDKKWATSYGLIEANMPEEQFVAGIHFHCDGHEDYCGFAGVLWRDVRFGMHMHEVINLLGEPSKRGGGKSSSVINGFTPQWIKYLVDEYIEIHFQFGVSGALELVTLGRIRVQRR